MKLFFAIQILLLSLTTQTALAIESGERWCPDGFIEQHLSFSNGTEIIQCFNPVQNLSPITVTAPAPIAPSAAPTAPTIPSVGPGGEATTGLPPATPPGDEELFAKMDCSSGDDYYRDFPGTQTVFHVENQSHEYLLIPHPTRRGFYLRAELLTDGTVFTTDQDSESAFEPEGYIYNNFRPISVNSAQRDAMVRKVLDLVQNPPGYHFLFQNCHWFVNQIKDAVNQRGYFCEDSRVTE